MATIRSVEAYKINQQAGGAHDVLSPNRDGKSYKAYFAWESTAATTADFVELVKVPAGARIVGISLHSEALGQTIDIGDADDDDRLVAAQASAALSGQVALNDDTVAFTSATEDAGPATGYGYVYTSETMIILTPNATLTAGKNVRGHIEYLL